MDAKHEAALLKELEAQVVTTHTRDAERKLWLCVASVGQSKVSRTVEEREYAMRGAAQLDDELTAQVIERELQLRKERKPRPTSRREICQQCRHWQPDPDDKDGKPIMGYCRRYAPRAVQSVDFDVQLTLWPAVASTDWCGEFA